MTSKVPTKLAAALDFDLEMMGTADGDNTAASDRSSTALMEERIVRGEHSAIRIAIAAEGTQRGKLRVPVTRGSHRHRIRRMLPIAMFLIFVGDHMLDCGNHVSRLSSAPKPPTEPGSTFARLTSHIPPGQFSRYTLIGIWNTIFGYGAYAGLTALFTPRLAYGYVLAAVVASLAGISVAFLGYKWFVFKTQGNYLREWLRCHLVYGTTTLISVAVLPVVVYALHRFARLGGSAPYLGGAVVTGVNVMISFLGHKGFSFARD